MVDFDGISQKEVLMYVMNELSDMVFPYSTNRMINDIIYA